MLFGDLELLHQLDGDEVEAGAPVYQHLGDGHIVDD
jgi:hypothetical protein